VHQAFFDGIENGFLVKNYEDLMKIFRTEYRKALPGGRTSVILE